MDFVKDWIIVQTLGEGAYGEVKLLVNKQSDQRVAMKIINTRDNPGIAKEVMKEVGIHKNLRHPNIIQFYGSRSHKKMEYIFLEYAAHGELFDRIEPEIGMKQSEAKNFFTQLLKGVDYLHSRGVAHRDIKPENILLDANDTLKISDLGLATCFRMGGKERLLDKKCGTLPYVAPEVLTRPYAAQPADIWSCGIVLVAMLAGELPWDQAIEDNDDYTKWTSGYYTKFAPWCKLDTPSLALLRKILRPAPSSRFTSANIQSSKWFTQQSNEGEITSLTAKRSRGSKGQPSNRTTDDDDITTSSSQIVTSNLSENTLKDFLSQPTSLDDMLLATQLLSTQTSSAQDILQKLVRRMTRFTVCLDLDEASDELKRIFGALKFEWKMGVATHFTVSTLDRRNNQLIFKANVMSMDRGTLLDFRLSRGCGLEFKKTFVIIRKLFKKSIISNPDVY
ncbi:serine threonine-protein kinase [Nesidiocoris tenuis]|uniref:non-specific serine/threonine protein kinase n=1 Tax=Nesidiocoris tenuis TaxID=355587 RepID=A0ABN7AQ17_9HEMI|nr:serine threonine-protein kinase [Nesidiocoris tenuis]